MAQVSGSGGELKISPEVFSPDGDGYHDVVTFSINPGEPGFTGNLSIYDAKGTLVKQLLRNEILGTDNTYSWDGVTEKGTKATIGIYVVYAEMFNLKGEVKKFKSVVVVGGKL